MATDKSFPKKKLKPNDNEAALAKDAGKPKRVVKKQSSLKKKY